MSTEQSKCCATGHTGFHSSNCETPQLYDVLAAGSVTDPAAANAAHERQPGEKFYKWTVQIEVDAIWVADGFDLTDERLHDMLRQHLAYAHGHEVRAKVLKAPKPEAILREQGYGDTAIAALLGKTNCA